MKVKVKTLKGTHFEIEVKLNDTVADVKKNIETVQGLYPAARQMLIHQGKILEDDTTMEENEVSDNSFIVVMLSMATNARPAPPPTPAAAPPPHPPSSTTNPPYNQTATHLVDRVNPPDVVHRFSKLSLHHPPLAGAAPPPAVNPRPQATLPPPASPSTPNANPLNLFPHDRPARNFDLINFIRNRREFHALRSAVRANPYFLRTIFQHMCNTSQLVARLFYENRAEVLRLIFEPVEGEEDGFGQPASRVSESFTVTEEDMDAMDRLEAMGFNSLLVWQAYFACDRNEDLAANYLLDHMRRFEE